MSKELPVPDQHKLEIRPIYRPGDWYVNSCTINSIEINWSEGLPERDVESLDLMGWGLEAAMNLFPRHRRRRRRRPSPEI